QGFTGVLFPQGKNMLLQSLLSVSICVICGLKTLFFIGLRAWPALDICHVTWGLLSQPLFSKPVFLH
ncbi:hypothetical protein, partial [Desulfonatronospira sp.]|uniref:hypothetical protein n=1 Tax=Desulfonatronospira sp. TaxID=1962951 RepID=UPI0025C1C63A